MKPRLKYVLLFLALAVASACALTLMTVREFYVVVDSTKRLVIIQVNDTWMELNRPTDTEVAIRYIPTKSFAQARLEVAQAKALAKKGRR